MTCRNGLHDLTQPGAVLRYRDGWTRCRACRLANARRNQVTEVGRKRRRRADEVYSATIPGQIAHMRDELTRRIARNEARVAELEMTFGPDSTRALV